MKLLKFPSSGTRHVVLPERFKKAEDFINFLIDYNFTPVIGFDSSFFGYLLPGSILDDGLIYIFLYGDVIKDMNVADNYIDMKVINKNKIIHLSIFYDSIVQIGCLESKTKYNFPDDNYDYNILNHINKEYEFNILEAYFSSDETKDSLDTAICKSKSKRY